MSSPLSRRDFLYLCSVSSIAAFLEACGVSNAPQPTNIALPNTIPSPSLSPTPIETPFPTASAIWPTDTPSPTVVPTSPPTETPIPSATATPTNTPSPTITNTSTATRPSLIVFKDDFRNGLIVSDSMQTWNYVDRLGGTVTIGPDPLNSTDFDGNPRGNVLIYTVGDGPQLEETGTQWVYWIFPKWNSGPRFPMVAAPCGVIHDVMIPDKPNYALGLGSEHRLNLADGSKTSVAAFGIHSDGSLIALVRDGKGHDTVVDNFGRVPFGEWFQMERRYDTDGTVTFKINGQPLVRLKVPVGPNLPAGFIDSHGGLQAGPTSGPNDKQLRSGIRCCMDNYVIYRDL